MNLNDWIEGRIGELETAVDLVHGWFNHGKQRGLEMKTKTYNGWSEDKSSESGGVELRVSFTDWLTRDVRFGNRFDDLVIDERGRLWDVIAEGKEESVISLKATSCPGIWCDGMIVVMHEGATFTTREGITLEVIFGKWEKVSIQFEGLS